MATIPLKKLQKLTILGYTKDDFSGTPIAFTAMYNPTSLSIQRGQKTAEKDSPESPVNPIQVLSSNNSSFSVELFFDGTGASTSGGIAGAIGAVAAAEALSGKLVTNAIDKFFEATLTMDNASHDSRFLEVIWGDGFYFPCKLTSATSNYLLFNQDGNPIRATINVSFVQTPSDKVAPNLGGKKSSFQSPDITKTHLVVAGDTIYNIAKNEYENESFYLQIAEANDLKNYRRLIPGQTLILPPISKV